MLSKIWISAITIAAGLLLALMLLIPGPLDRALLRERRTRMEQLRSVAEMTIRLEVRDWIDHAGQLAVDPALVRIVQQYRGDGIESIRETERALLAQLSYMKRKWDVACRFVCLNCMQM